MSTKREDSATTTVDFTDFQPREIKNTTTDLQTEIHEFSTHPTMTTVSRNVNDSSSGVAQLSSAPKPPKSFDMWLSEKSNSWSGDKERVSTKNSKKTDRILNENHTQSAKFERSNPNEGRAKGPPIKAAPIPRMSSAMLSGQSRPPSLTPGWESAITHFARDSFLSTIPKTKSNKSTLTATSEDDRQSVYSEKTTGTEMTGVDIIFSEAETDSNDGEVDAPPRPMLESKFLAPLTESERKKLPKDLVVVYTCPTNTPVDLRGIKRVRLLFENRSDLTHLPEVFVQRKSKVSIHIVSCPNIYSISSDFPNGIRTFVAKHCPSLADLTGLRKRVRYVRLKNCGISDVSPLDYCKRVILKDLKDVRDISQLANCRKVHCVRLRNLERKPPSHSKCKIKVRD